MLRCVVIAILVVTPQFACPCPLAPAFTLRATARSGRGRRPRRRWAPVHHRPPTIHPASSGSQQWGRCSGRPGHRCHSLSSSLLSPCPCTCFVVVLSWSSCRHSVILLLPHLVRHRAPAAYPASRGSQRWLGVLLWSCRPGVVSVL